MMAPMITKPTVRIFHAAVLLLLGCDLAQADTIVLKNGKRILALSVTEDGDKVRYLTSAGELSLPKFIVDHIEKNDIVPGVVQSAAAKIGITPPPEQPSPALDNLEISRGAVHAGSVDRVFIAKMENEARSNTREANLGAAIAHHAAAVFELSRGDMEHALDDERSALIYAPDEPGLLLNAAYIRLRRSEYKGALDYLERAQTLAPENPDVAKLQGWSYYGLNKLDQAVACWKRALALRPEKEVQEALGRALRDQDEEANYKENESSHFKLKYSGAAEPALAREILKTLEAHFAAIDTELNYRPPEAIGVILYTQEAFTDITRAPGWVGALYDGRIRVPVRGLTQVNSELSRTLKHELTHSFIAQLTRSACMASAGGCTARPPTWLQEGMAQWMEGQRSTNSAALLVQLYNDGQSKSLGELEGGWMALDNQGALYAYAWALANIEFIISVDGMNDIQKILQKIGNGMTTESALREVLHSDYNDLMQATVAYLRRNYVR
jgi:tetratricopeptide (TPR) repeat protein